MGRLYTQLQGLWRARGLVGQWLIGAALLAATLALAAMAWTTWHAREASLAASREWAQSLARAAAHASAHALITRDLGGLDLALADLASLPGVLQVEVQDTSGLPLLRLTGPTRGGAALRIDHRPAERLFAAVAPRGAHAATVLDRPAVVAWEPVSAGLPQGYVGVAHAPAAALPVLQGQVLLPGWALVGGLALVLAWGAWLLRGVLRPLRTLTRHAQDPAHVADASLAPHSPDIDALGQAVLKLVSRLQSQLARLGLSEANLRAAIEGSPDGVVLLSPSGRVVMMNAACRRTLRLGPADYVDQPIRRWLPDYTSAWVEDPSARQPGVAVGDEAMRIQQTTARRKDGQPFPAEVSLSFVNEGGLSQYICVLRDVTERDRTRTQLAERTARFNAVVDLSPDGIALFDGRGQLVFANPALGEMMGWAEAIGWQDLSLAAFERHFTTLSATGRGFPPLGAGLRSDEPDVLVIERPRHRVLARSWRRNPGAGQEAVLYFRDITHETEVDRMKSEFLNSAAHELRTPLASIFGFTELMLRRPMEAERQRELLGTVHQQADRLSRIINELLDIARIEARQGLDFAIHPVALGPLVRDTLASLVVPHDPRTVQVDLHDEAALLQADADKTRQALLNLLTNAYKYSPGGGPIRLRSWQDDAHHPPMVAIAVEDHGMGMTADQMTHLFERFWRADTSGHIPGTGLGLSLVKEIVELQQGRVQVHSEWQRGTTVTIRLPASAAQTSEPGAGPA